MKEVESVQKGDGVQNKEGGTEGSRGREKKKVCMSLVKGVKGYKKIIGEAMKKEDKESEKTD